MCHVKYLAYICITNAHVNKKKNRYIYLKFDNWK